MGRLQVSDPTNRPCARSELLQDYPLQMGMFSLHCVQGYWCWKHAQLTKIDTVYDCHPGEHSTADLEIWGHHPASSGFSLQSSYNGQVAIFYLIGTSCAQACKYWPLCRGLGVLNSGL
ncbi:hypothetical protein AAY473_037838 [Plecturocebus cupreus]